MENEAQNSLFEMPGKPVVKIFGVGNAGISLLGMLATPEFEGAHLAAVNTDAPSLAATTAPVKIHLENKLLRGLGSGGDPDRARAMAEEQFSTLKSACEGANVVCILAGLGGGSGSGISPVLAKAAREAGALVLAFVTLPFDCEGNRREAQAQQSLEHLKSAADGVICLPSQKIFKLIDENTSLLETFRFTSGFLIEGVRGVWQLITRPGLIQVHFADLSGLLRDRHSENVFAFVEASGAARSREAVEKMMAHPLLDEGRALADLRRGAGEPDGGEGPDDGRGEPRDGTGEAPVRARADHHGRGGGRGVEKQIMRHDHRGQANHPGGESSHANGRSNHAIHGDGQPGSGSFGAGSRATRTKASKAIQTQLPLTIISKGRFDKSEPTLHHGEDLDVPTFLRRGIALN